MKFITISVVSRHFPFLSIDNSMIKRVKIGYHGKTRRYYSPDHPDSKTNTGVLTPSSTARVVDGLLFSDQYKFYRVVHSHHIGLVNVVFYSNEK